MVSTDPTSETVRTFCSGAETAAAPSVFCWADSGVLEVVRAGKWLRGGDAPLRLAAGFEGSPLWDRAPSPCSDGFGFRLLERSCVPVFWPDANEVVLLTGRTLLLSCAIRCCLGSIGSSGDDAGETGDTIVSTIGPLKSFWSYSGVGKRTGDEMDVFFV